MAEMKPKDCETVAENKEESTEACLGDNIESCRTDSNLPNEIPEDPKKKDFMKTPKYNDTVSYALQHHHSIGTGLFLTDDIKDLPPRYRTKVIKALETGAALNNIPLDKIPMIDFRKEESENSDDDSDFDSLVIPAPHSAVNGQATFKHSHGSCKKDSRKTISSSSSNIASSSVSDKTNSQPSTSKNFNKTRTFLKSESQISTNAKCCDNQIDNLHPGKFNENTHKKTSCFNQRPNSSQFNPKFKEAQSLSKHSSYSVPNSDVPNRKNRHFDQSSESRSLMTEGSVNNTNYPKKPYNHSHDASNSSHSVKNESSKPKNFSQKQYKDNWEDSEPCNRDSHNKRRSYTESFNSRESKLSVQGETSLSKNFSGKKPPPFSNKGHNRPRTVSTSSHSSIGSYSPKDLPCAESKGNSKNTFNESHKNFNNTENSANSCSQNGPMSRNSHRTISPSSSHSSSFSSQSKNVVKRRTGGNGSGSFDETQRNVKNVHNQNYRRSPSPPFSVSSSVSHSSKDASNEQNCEQRNSHCHFNKKHRDTGYSKDSLNSDCSSGSYNKKQGCKYREKVDYRSDNVQNNFHRENNRDYRRSPSPPFSRSSSVSHSSKGTSNEQNFEHRNNHFNKKNRDTGYSKDSLNSDCSSGSYNKKQGSKYREKVDYRSDNVQKNFHRENNEDSSDHSFRSKGNKTSSTLCTSEYQKFNQPKSKMTAGVHKHSDDQISSQHDRKFNERKDQNRSRVLRGQEQNDQDFKVSSAKSSSYSVDENRKNKSKQSNVGRNYDVTDSRLNDKSEKNSYRSKEDQKYSDRTQNRSCFDEENAEPNRNINSCVEYGFFIKIKVSENARNLEYWLDFFRKVFNTDCQNQTKKIQFDLERCCHFSDILILEFNFKNEALKAVNSLKIKKKLQNYKMPYIVDISSLKYHLYKPCGCKQNVVDDIMSSVESRAGKSLSIIADKMKEIRKFRTETKKSRHSVNDKIAQEEMWEAKEGMLKLFKDNRFNFVQFLKDIKEKISKAESLKTIEKLKVSFIRECNAFERCLPIYSKKDEILKSIRSYSVSVIVAETGSGKSTQLVQYLLHSDFSKYGLIICTQPRKVAAISIAQFVSGQMGSPVGKIVGYEAGVERKTSESTKILYMTDYCLLKKYLKNPTLKGISCIIIDEAHERSLYTDLLLGMLKKSIESRIDLRVIITSATMNPTVFVDYFKLRSQSVIEVPGRSFPVEVVWWHENVDKGWNYVAACARKVYEIYRSHSEGDILVFLTSSNESEEAIDLLKNMLSNRDKQLRLLSLHGKSDIKEQMAVFQTTQTSRKIVFATNVAETSVTIPGIKFVVDSGMTKDLKFDPKMNKSYLEICFINKSAAEQRKGRAGRTQSGVCYRMYSQRNYEENMEDNAVAEIMKVNLQRALLKVFELGINPKNFDFIETPPERTISNSIESLEYLGAVENNKLTELGKKIAKLPVEPQLGKLILKGIDAGVGYEIVIIAALVAESAKLFVWNEDRSLADNKKKKFCQTGGDLCTYFEIYRRWKEVDVRERYSWCQSNYIRSKSLQSAAKTIYEIINSLKFDLNLTFSKKYNISIFKKQFEKLIFDCFSENLCVSSGHPKLGYLSPYLAESFFIHPSSTLSYLGKDVPEFLVYRTLMETSRNFLFDVTPISEETIRLANQEGSFKLPLHSLKCLQVPPKTLGPFGESLLVRYILGKEGCKIKELEAKLISLTKVKNIYVDVVVDKGMITIYMPQRFHKRVSEDINKVIEEARDEMLKEEDVAKLSGTSLYFALSSGGVINDIIMPGEFRELVLSNFKPKDINDIENSLSKYGPLQSVCHNRSSQGVQISVTYKSVCDAQTAFESLKKEKYFEVASKPCLPNVSDKTLPLYVLNVSWCRCPCTGYGSVEFSSEEDMIVASNALTCRSFTIDNNIVMFSPSERSSKQLDIKNLPKTVNELSIRSKLRESLPKDIKVGIINIYRKRDISNLKSAKSKLSTLFNQYVLSTKFVIDMNDLKNEAMWSASVYFEHLEDAENAYMKLKDNTMIDYYPLNVKLVFKSSFFCKKRVYNKLSEQIQCILEQKKEEGTCEEFSVKELGGKDMYDMSITFTCINIEELNKTRQILRYFLLGESLDLVGTSKYNFLFFDCNNELIKRIQRSTNTWIEVDKSRRKITIYGSSSNCWIAMKKIYALESDSDFSFTRTFNLRDSCIPMGFLKALYTKFGYDLRGMMSQFKLIVAKVDNFGKTLTFKGLKKEIHKAEQALEELCAELFKSRGERKKTDSQQEICPVCFDPVSYDFRRLEICGHAFCPECLLLQLQSNTLPLVCVKENCGKLIYLEDIKRIITYKADHLEEDHRKKAFVAVALQHHVRGNIKKISYCPTPDCQMIYRITREGLEFKCPACKNSTCTHCQSPYHYGMSCEMFQNCRKDEDYSLRTWVKEHGSVSKRCPSCNVVIEKDSGCNHMECTNCQAHFCWLCVQIFPSGEEVYKHMPYCPLNQSN